MSLRLQSIVVGEGSSPWEAAGFTVADDLITIGSLVVECRGDAETRSRWSFGGAGRLLTVDGISVVRSAHASRMGSDPDRDAHPNRVIDLDHVVMRSPDLDRTTAMLENLGIECRRIRDVPLGDSPIQQRFFRIPTGRDDADTSTILELVGPLEPTQGGPATIWGLACVVDDIDAAVAHLGDACSDARDAVQPGRRIATVRTRDLGIGMTLAFMTPRR